MEINKIKLDPKFKEKLMRLNIELYKGFEMFKSDFKDSKKNNNSRDAEFGNKTFMITQLIKSFDDKCIPVDTDGNLFE